MSFVIITTDACFRNNTRKRVPFTKPFGDILGELFHSLESWKGWKCFSWCTTENRECKKVAIEYFCRPTVCKYVSMPPSLTNNLNKWMGPYSLLIGLSGCSLSMSACCSLSNLYNNWLPSITSKYSFIPAVTSKMAFSFWVMSSSFGLFPPVLALT